MRGNDDNAIETAMSCTPTGRKPRVRTRNRWSGVVEQGLKRIGVNDWRNITPDREDWCEVGMVANTLVE